MLLTHTTGKRRERHESVGDLGSVGCERDGIMRSKYELYMHYLYKYINVIKKHIVYNLYILKSFLILQNGTIAHF